MAFSFKKRGDSKFILFLGMGRNWSKECPESFFPLVLLCGPLSCGAKISLGWYVLGFVTKLTLKLKCLGWGFSWCRLVDLHLCSSTLYTQESRQPYWYFHWRSLQCRRTCFCCMETSTTSLWFPKEKIKTKKKNPKDRKVGDKTWLGGSQNG